MAGEDAAVPGGPRDHEGEGPLVDQLAEVPVLDSELLVRGRVWDVRRDRFEFGGDVLTREYLDHTGAVAVVALDADDRVLLIQQYRHAIAHRDWEIPAGLMDAPGESGATSVACSQADTSAPRSPSRWAASARSSRPSSLGCRVRACSSAR